MNADHMKQAPKPLDTKWEKLTEDSAVINKT